MLNKQDLTADIEMYFNQITNLIDLMLNQDNNESPNLLTIRGLAEQGLFKIKKLSNMNNLV